MIELVSFCFCQTQSLAGSPTWWQVVRQHVWFTLGKVSVLIVSKISFSEIPSMTPLIRLDHLAEPTEYAQVRFLEIQIYLPHVLRELSSASISRCIE